MKELIKHFVKNNPEDVGTKSLYNCHVEGLHSIMLFDSPGKTIRLFITSIGRHTLFIPDVLAHHPHHCDLTLVCVKGKFENRIDFFEQDNEGPYSKFLYKSFINTGKFGFEKLDGKYSSYFSYVERVEEGQSVFMKANVYHTVFVPQSQYAAWLVFEGKENSNYQPLCYSKNPLEDIKAKEKHMYLPMNLEQATNELKFYNLI